MERIRFLEMHISDADPSMEAYFLHKNRKRTLQYIVYISYHSALVSETACPASEHVPEINQYILIEIEWKEVQGFFRKHVHMRIILRRWTNNVRYIGRKRRVPDRHLTLALDTSRGLYGLHDFLWCLLCVEWFLGLYANLPLGALYPTWISDHMTDALSTYLVGNISQSIHTYATFWSVFCPNTASKSGFGERKCQE